MASNQKEQKNCSGCCATGILLEKQLQDLAPMLRRVKLRKRHNLKKPRWNGFSKQLFEN